jgi:hypothetical protein
MKHLMIAAAAMFGLAGWAHAAPAEGPLMAPVHQFIDSFNKGDIKGARAAHAAGAIAIMDEVPPHIWTGPKAFDSWVASLAAHDKAEGVTDQAVTIGEPLRQVVSGTHGYVVVQAVYTYKVKGAPTREPAEMTFSLVRVGGAWRINGWAWDGTEPQPAGN